MSDEKEMEYLKHASADIRAGDECDGNCGDVFEEDKLIYIVIYSVEDDECEVFCHSCAADKWDNPMAKIQEVQQKRRDNGLNSPTEDDEQ